MSISSTVKVSKRFQIAVPRVAREQLNIQSGDRLHREIWEGVDTNEYISGERAAWDASQNG